MSKHTEDYGNFLVGFGKWVGNALLGKNDKRTIESCSQP